jgi:hypothetical protein
VRRYQSAYTLRRRADEVVSRVQEAMSLFREKFSMQSMFCRAHQISARIHDNFTHCNPRICIANYVQF